MAQFRLRVVLNSCVVLLGFIGLPSIGQAEEGITKSWAIAEFGEPLYKDGIEHWPYANPNAPKGGKIVLGTKGSFDTFNPNILKGEFPGTIGLIYDSLMTGSDDEIMAAYGLIAETAEYPADKSWIIFNLRPEARFTDGVPIVGADFCFTLEIYKEHVDSVHFL